MKHSLLAQAVLALATGAALAQPRMRDQGDWPCRQVRVAAISAAGVWTGPSLDAAGKNWRDDAALAELVPRLAARRTPIDEAERAIADFAKAAGAQKTQRLTVLVAGLFDRLDSERREIVAGLDRYGAKQKDLAEKLRGAQDALRELQDKTKTGEGVEKLKDASEALQWELRIFEERRKALTFVCETPALIEQRLGALARAAQAAME
jgi:hypothetical protein